MPGIDPEAAAILEKRFGKDTLLSLATIDGNRPAVRTVNSYYADGCFFIITYALSGKMKQILRNPEVAVCAEWFTAHGTATSLGWLMAPENTKLLATLQHVFAAWYGNGHIQEADHNTCILKIRLTDGVLMSHGTRYTLTFDA